MKLGKRAFFITLSIGLILIIVVGICNIWGVGYLSRYINDAQRLSLENVNQRSKDITNEYVNDYAKVVCDKQSDGLNSKLSTISNEINVVSVYLSHLYNKNSSAGSANENDYISLQPGVSKSDVYNEYNKIKIIKDLMGDFTDDILYVSESGMKISRSSSGEIQKNDDLNNVDLRKMDWYKNAAESGNAYWSGIYTDSETQQMKLTYSLPIYDRSGTFKGVLAKNIPVNNFFSNIKAQKNYPDAKYYFLLNKHNNFILKCTEDAITTEHVSDELYNKILDKVSASKDNNDVVKLNNNVAAYSAVENNNWKLVMVFDYDDLLSSSYKNIVDEYSNADSEIFSGISKKNYNIFILYIVVLVILLLFVFIISRKVYNKVLMMTGGIKKVLKEIRLDNLNKEVHIEELDEISDEFNEMAVDLEGQVYNLKKIIAEEKRISTELEIARTIQTSMLPTVFPAFSSIDEVDLYATARPAKEVGGDFYDFFVLDEDRIVFIIADVSGKGVPASLFMVIAKTLIKDQAQLGLSPKEILRSVNESLCENNQANMFVTAIVGIFNFKTGEITFSNAGHNLPLIYRKGRGFEWLKLKPNFILAGMRNINYVNETVLLEKGDKVFLYTDGVTEALNNNKELFSENRLINCLNDGSINDSTNAKDILNHVQSGVDDFTKGAEQADDITMLVISYKDDESKDYD